MSNRWQRKLFFFILGPVVVLLILLLSLMSFRSLQYLNQNLPKLTGYEDKVFATRLLPEDLPASYRNRGTASDTKLGGIYGQKYIRYGNQFTPVASIVQEIVVFDNSKDATQTLEAEVNAWGNRRFQSKDQALLQKEEFSADQVVTGCDQTIVVRDGTGKTAQSRLCITIFTNTTVFVEITARVFEDTELLTMTEYQQLVRVIDKRVAHVFYPGQ